MSWFEKNEGDGDSDSDNIEMLIREEEMDGRVSTVHQDSLFEVEDPEPN